MRPLTTEDQGDGHAGQARARRVTAEAAGALYPRPPALAPDEEAQGAPAARDDAGESLATGPGAAASAANRPDAGLGEATAEAGSGGAARWVGPALGLASLGVLAGWAVAHPAPLEAASATVTEIRRALAGDGA